VQKLEKTCRSKQKQHVLMVLLLTLQRRGELGIGGVERLRSQEQDVADSDEHAKIGTVISSLDRLGGHRTKGPKELSKGSKFVLPSTAGDRPATPK